MNKIAESTAIPDPSMHVAEACVAFTCLPRSNRSDRSTPVRHHRGTSSLRKGPPSIGSNEGGQLGLYPQHLTVASSGSNENAALGQGDRSNRGDDANGPCPPSSTTAFVVPPQSVPTLDPVPRMQRWGRIFLRSTWGLGRLP